MKNEPKQHKCKHNRQKLDKVSSYTISCKDPISCTGKDDEYWKNNPYGWRRWEAVLAHMNQKDNSFLLPGFKEYVNKLDAIRGVNAKNIFPELGHLL